MERNSKFDDSYLDSELAKEIFRRFDINVFKVERIRKVWKLSTDKGVKILKRSKQKDSDLLFIHAAKEHLVRNGFTKIDRFNLSIDGNPFVELEKQLFVLTDWIESRESNYDNMTELQIATATLANFHTATKGFRPQTDSTDRIRWGKWTHSMQHKLDELAKFKEMANAKKAKTSFDNKFLRDVDYYLIEGRKALELLDRSGYVDINASNERDGYFCHHDYSNRNVLLDSANNAHLIDFDYCICDIRAHDISSLILRNLKKNNWDIKLAVFIIEHYNKVSRISNEELKVILAILHWPQDFWQVGLQYYVEDLPWAYSRYLSSLKRKIGGKKKRRNFLLDFASFIGFKI